MPSQHQAVAKTIVEKDQDVNLYGAENQNNPGELGQSPGCCCPGSLSHQAISNNGTDLAGYNYPLSSMQKDFKYLCLLSVEKLQTKQIYLYIFEKKNSACQELRHPTRRPFMPCCCSWDMCMVGRIDWNKTNPRHFLGMALAITRLIKTQKRTAMNATFRWTFIIMLKRKLLMSYWYFRMGVNLKCRIHWDLISPYGDRDLGQHCPK